MSAREPSADEFLKHVEQHKLTIAHDDGLHRHLTFRRVDTNARYFHLTTWPGYLAITGDMGDYVFARLPDMFEFFRGDHDINPGYWGEKLQAIARNEGYREFSRAHFRRALVSDFRQVYPSGTPERLAIWKELRWDLLDFGEPDSLEEAVGKVMSWSDPNGQKLFRDFWDHTLEDYTYHFIWCCRAIRWGIEQYDAAKAPAVAA